MVDSDQLGNMVKSLVGGLFGRIDYNLFSQARRGDFSGERITAVVHGCWYVVDTLLVCLSFAEMWHQPFS